MLPLLFVFFIYYHNKFPSFSYTETDPVIIAQKGVQKFKQEVFILLNLALLFCIKNK
jgi:hypothetical protein